MPQFSRFTIIELINSLESLTTAVFDRLLLKYSLEEKVPTSIGSMPKRLNVLAKYLIDNTNEIGPMGCSLSLELIEEEIGRHNRSASRRYDHSLEKSMPGLINSLKRDGYAVDSGKLKIMLPEQIQIVEKENELNILLEEFGFNVAKGHFEQAINAHTRGEWASANSQLRTFIESVFDCIAEKVKKENDELPITSHQRREYLAKLEPPFLLNSLNEWEIGDKGGFVQGFWKRLHPEGSHPGLSDEEDSTFRLHIVILIAHHFLRRLKRYICSRIVC